MAESTDPGDKTLENSTTHESEKPSDINTPFTKSENMPASAHPLHNSFGRNIRHYFFEFLMIFLAVFCGLISWLENVNSEGKDLVMIIQQEYHIK